MVSVQGWELEGSSGTEGFGDLGILVLIHHNQLLCKNPVLQGQPGWCVHLCGFKCDTHAHTLSRLPAAGRGEQAGLVSCIIFCSVQGTPDLLINKLVIY